MYISDESCRRTAIAYGWIGLGCLLFSALYECFSHGVYAAPMLCLCLYPWGGGALLFWLIKRIRFRPSISVCRMWHAGMATLTVGSAVTGVVEIYGTDCPYLLVYYIVGGVLCAGGALLGCIRHQKKNHRCD